MRCLDQTARAYLLIETLRRFLVEQRNARIRAVEPEIPIYHECFLASSGLADAPVGLTGSCPWGQHPRCGSRHPSLESRSVLQVAKALLPVTIAQDGKITLGTGLPTHQTLAKPRFESGSVFDGRCR